MASVDKERCCRQFESRWFADPNVSIESFVAELDITSSEVFCELILVDVELRHRAGLPVSAQDYLQRFPEYSSTVTTAFERLTKVYLPKIDLSHPTEEVDWVGKQLGSYQVVEKIGVGAFGAVCKAVDVISGVPYAIKIPHRELAVDQEVVETEAQCVTELSHPAIVRTIEVVSCGDVFAIVQEYVDGVDLGEYTSQSLVPESVAVLIADVTDAVSAAHAHGVVHRDLKPSNILVDRHGHPRVTDFGLALNLDQQIFHRGERVGSPAYMSPELVRGESHLLDGRSDIWSIGVILYEVLTGHRPFEGDSANVVFDSILIRNPTPLRQLNPEVPEELERICLKCLSRNIKDRYANAAELSEELRAFAETPEPVSNDSTVALDPQGLRSFRKEDCRFFLRLLPGARDRFGLPGNVRFWKRAIENRKEDSFVIGFMYGPSGSGKSSFVQAGVIPKLASFVVPVYVESTADDTEVRILKALRKQFPDIDSSLALPQVFKALREGSWLPRHSVLLIVLDQFEQWLHARKSTLEEQLIQALRHCDGVRVKTLIMVRDDFWLASSKLSSALDVEIIDRHNAMLVERFDLDHAEKVLFEYGRSLGKLPEAQEDLTEGQSRFLRVVARDLSEDQCVIPVRISLFVEMFKSRPWNCQELEDVGGVAGVGEKFLHSTFSSTNSPAKYRKFEEASRRVLESLLPANDISIRVHFRSADLMKEASGLSEQEFSSLLEILDKDLRLITPVDPDSSSTDSEQNAQETRFYQLTHDYLVPSVRNWLFAKRKSTWRGRTELLLDDLERRWAPERGRKAIPGPLELIQIDWCIPRASMSQDAKSLVRLAHWQYLSSGLLIFGVMSLLVASAVLYTSWSIARRHALENALTCHGSMFPDRLEELSGYFPSLAELVQQKQEDTDTPWQDRLAMIRLFYDSELNVSSLNRLVESLSDAENNEVKNSSIACKNHRDEVLEWLEAKFQNTDKQSISLNEIAFELGLSSCGLLEQICDDRTQPDLQTELMLRLHPFFKNDVSFVSEFLQQTQSDIALYVLIIALGKVGPSIANANGFDELHKVVQSLYCEHEHGGVHYACQWTLSQWRMQTTVPQFDTHEPGDREWWHFQVDNQRIDLVKIPKGAFQRGAGSSGRWWYPAEKVELKSSYWIATCETSSRLIQIWRQAEGHDGILGPDFPATNVSVPDTLEFLHWLNSEFTSGGTFRLPTPDEWEKAARAHVSGTYAWGNVGNVETCRQFAVIDDDGDGNAHLAPSRSRIPNFFGLFDVSGNVWELCQFEDSAKYPGLLISRGGSFNADRPFLIVDRFLLEEKDAEGRDSLGFRIIWSADKKP